MNTRDFDYFLSLTKTGNFSQTAEKFAVSQPTITTAIKRLEDYFHAQLIIRDRRHHDISVTPAGEQLAAHAAIILNQLTLAQQDIAWEKKTKIRFGLPPIIGGYLFPKIAPDLINTGLMPQLEAIEAGSAALLDQIKAGKLDFAVLGASGPLVESDLHVVQINAAPFVIITRKDDPLAANKSVRFATLAKRQFITLSEGFVHTRAFAWFEQRHTFSPNIVYRTGDVPLLKRLVRQNVGLGFLTRIAINPDDRLATLALDDAHQPAFPISLVHPKDRVLTPAMKRFESILKSYK